MIHRLLHDEWTLFIIDIGCFAFLEEDVRVLGGAANHRMVRAVTWKTVGRSSPAILNMFGSINRSPWDAVNVVASEPVCNMPWMAPAAPPSLCIWTMAGMVPHRFFFFSEAHWSHHSAMVE